MSSLSETEILRLCDEQAYLFSCSTSYNFSSENFYLTILKSIETRSMDDGVYVDLFHLLNSVKNKKKKNIKYPEKVMHWIGYLTRYMALTTELNSNDIANLISCKELSELYPALHTQDIAKASQAILELKKDEIVNKNVRLKRLLTKEEKESIIIQ